MRDAQSSQKSEEKLKAGSENMTQMMEYLAVIIWSIWLAVWRLYKALLRRLVSIHTWIFHKISRTLACLSARTRTRENPAEGQTSVTTAVCTMLDFRRVLRFLRVLTTRGPPPDQPATDGPQYH